MRTCYYRRRPKLPGVKRGVAVAGVAAAAALAARQYLVNRDAMADVAPQLRTPLLLVLPPPSSRRMLPISRFNSRLRTPSGRGVTVAKHLTGDGVRVVVTAPSMGSRPRPVVLWIHGGVFVVGSPQFEAFETGQIAREVGAVVVSPDYRLAPEHPFPAALDDCMSALGWIRANVEMLGIDPQRIAIAGSSAGGGLAAAVVHCCRDQGIAIAAQTLVYPMLDDRTALRADHAGRGRFLLTPASIRLGWRSYVGGEPGNADVSAYAAPARQADLNGLAPAWIGVGDLDLLYDESVAYAQRLRECGVDCELITVPGMYHAADVIARNTPPMLKFRASMLDHLKTHLSAVQ
jgi:acetyl esterase/lipase